MATYKIGDRIIARPFVNIYARGDQATPIVAGTVVWVNPDHRWLTAVFEVAKATIRESFKFDSVTHCKEGWSI